MTRGEAAKFLRINAETLRYYEDINLIEPEYNHSGYRVYNDRTLNRLELIVRFKRFGFSLKEIRQFFELIGKARGNPEPLREFLDEKIEDLEERIRGLEGVKNSLVSFRTREDKESCSLYSQFMDSP